MMYNWQGIAEIFGYIASVAVGLRILWKLLVHLKYRLRGMFGISQLQTEMEALAASMKYVVDELNPNGGASIRDALVRIEGVVTLTNEIQHSRMLDSPTLLFRTDAAGYCVWVNRTYARAVKRLPMELKGLGWVNSIAEGQRSHVMAAWQAAIRETREIELTLDFQTPDGDLLPAAIRSYKMVNSQGEAIGYLVSIALA